MRKAIIRFLATALFALILIPNTSQATMLGPCDHQNSWANLKIGDKDTNISDIGPIMGLQQLISEPDLVHTLGGMGGPTPGEFDTPTRVLLIAWQIKHGIITTSPTDPERGIIGEKTKAVIKNYCGGGETITHTLVYPLVSGGFDSIAGYPVGKYTNRVADHALRLLIQNGPGAGGSSSTGGELFSPFNSYDLSQRGYSIGNNLSFWNLYMGVSIESGVATVRFDSRALPFFDHAAVSGLVRGSIERTLKQFPTITSVRFEVVQDNHSAPSTVIRAYDGSVASTVTGTDNASKIAALQVQIAELMKIIAQLLATRGQTTNSGSSCFVPTFDLYIGKTDAVTNGEITKLQQFLAKEGYFGNPNDQTGLSLQPTGYYGQKTAEAVVKWQKAHGMDFVTTKSGVGKMTREKMREICGGTTIPQCAKYDDPPVISSISPSSGPVGTRIVVNGCNFLGFESDKDLWVKNSNGIKGILFGERDASNTTLQATLPPALCQINTSYSGLECPATLNLVPGVYSIQASGWGGLSNSMTFTVTAQ